MSRCRVHCPNGRGGGWLHLLLFLVLMVAFCKGAGYVAPVVSSMAGAVVTAVIAIVVAAAVTVASTLAVHAVLNRRARARYAALEREAWAEPEVAAPAALTPAARALDAAPTVRAEAFVEHAWDAA